MLDRSYLGHFVEEVKDLVMGDLELKLFRISRTQNGIADFLAKFARREHLTNVWFQDVPSDVAVLLAS